MLNFVQNVGMNLKNNSYYVIGSFYSYQSFFIFNINFIRLSVVLKNNLQRIFLFKNIFYEIQLLFKIYQLNKRILL